VSLSAGPLAGSYKESYGYNPYTGAMDGMTLPGGGGLLQESISIGYDTANRPVSLGGLSGTIVNTLSYTELGQPQQYALGGGPTATWIQDAWDLGTGRLASSEVQAGSASPVTLDATTYGYSNAGQVTSAADTPSGGPAQVQCFDHDYLGRLTQAWSQASSDCSGGPSPSAESGAAAPYWEQYAYNQQNALTSQTSTTTDGASSTTSYGYPAPGSPQPHAPATQQVTGQSGSTTTTYAYDAAGHLTGSAGQPGNQSLSWDDAGRLTSVSTSAGSTSYVYDASGNLLLQTGPGTATLYLPGEQLTENTATQAVTAVRYYTIGGTTVAALSTGGHLHWLAGNQQGTSTLAIDTATLTPAYRYDDPYGNPAGPVPSSWPGNRGFVNGTADPATTLTNLGAREYQPATATFISPDPLLNPYNPQHLNPYAYAQDDPATLADPNGLCPVDRCGFGVVNNGIIYRHGPIDPGNPGGAWIPASCAGCGSYPVASAPPLTPYQIAVEFGSLPATPHIPTVTDITAITRQYGYRGSADFTIADMIRWLPGAASNRWTGNGAWDEYCQGLEGRPTSACGTNPFTGDTGIYGDPVGQLLSQFWHHPLQTTLAMLGLAYAIATPMIIAAGGPEAGAPDDLAITAADTAAEDAGSKIPAVIYRGGSRTDLQLTDNGTGVSFRDSLSNPVGKGLQPVLRPGEKYFAVDTSQLPPESVVYDNDPIGHVGVFGLEPQVIRDAIIEELSGRFPR
jgi:RHS repeat-associated protein